MYVYKSLQYALNNPDIPINVLYLSFELSREVLLAKLLSLYLLDTYHVDISYKEIFSLSDKISKENLEYIYKAREWLEKVDDKLTIYDQPLDNAGIYNILHYFASHFGTFEKTESGEIYKKRDPKQYLICVLDHCKLIKNKGNGLKYEIDETCKHFVYFRNLCDMTICAVQQANRQFMSMDRRTSEHNYLELQDISDSSDLANASEIVLGLYYPYREKRTKCEGFDIKKLKSDFRLILLLKSRFGQSDIAIGNIFKGKIGYFKELAPPEETKSIDYDKVLSLEYLYSDPKELEITKEKQENKDENKLSFDIYQ